MPGRSAAFSAHQEGDLGSSGTEALTRPRLYRVIWPVDDIERAADFYRQLLGVDGKRVSAGRHYFDCAGTILAC